MPQIAARVRVAHRQRYKEAMRSLPFLFVLAACGGGQSQIEIGPVPAARTTGTLSGPLCQNTECSCRKGAEDAGFPDGARKRFEFRLKSAQQLWLKLPGDTMLYKNAEKPEVCFYVDLAPGQHGLELRGSDKVGVSAELIVRELGTKTKSWYETFRFECGNPGACSFEELDNLKADYASAEKNLFDKCGSTKVKSILWDHGKAPDGTHPSELVVRATLDVYKFPPWKAHGDPTCGQGRGPDEVDADPEAEKEPAPDAPAPAP
jgi:hypothetical protein